MGIRKFGILYCGGQAVVPGGCAHDSMPISIGDTAPGYELQWVEAGNLLVADRCACIDISWVTLDSLGYIFGTPIEIDGKMYICRSLKVGTDEVVEYEWDSLLNEFGDDDNLWHWLGKCFGARRLQRICRRSEQLADMNPPERGAEYSKSTNPRSLDFGQFWKSCLPLPWILPL